MSMMYFINMKYNVCIFRKTSHDSFLGALPKAQQKGLLGGTSSKTGRCVNPVRRCLNERSDVGNHTSQAGPGQHSTAASLPIWFLPVCKNQQD
jgi:hypothetical protein